MSLQERMILWGRVLKRGAPRQPAVPRANRDSGFEKSGLNVEVDGNVQLISKLLMKDGDIVPLAPLTRVTHNLRFRSERLFPTEAQGRCL